MSTWSRSAPQEGVGEFLLVVRGDHDDRAVPRGDLLAGLDDAEAHFVELTQQVVGKFEVGIVDLVDEQDVALRSGERLAERAELDVAADIGDIAGAEAAVVGPKLPPAPNCAKTKGSDLPNRAENPWRPPPEAADGFVPSTIWCCGPTRGLDLHGELLGEQPLQSGGSVCAQDRRVLGI
jgi:hypothetical protein